MKNMDDIKMLSKKELGTLSVTNPILFAKKSIVGIAALSIPYPFILSHDMNKKEKVIMFVSCSMTYLLWSWFVFFTHSWFLWYVAFLFAQFLAIVITAIIDEETN